MKSLTLTPAYGRDYKSAKVVKEDFNSNKDFIVADFFNPYDDKSANKQDLTGDYSQVMIRYNKLMSITVIKLGS